MASLTDIANQINYIWRLLREIVKFLEALITAQMWEAALQRVDRIKKPQRWARLQTLLADSLIKNQLWQRANNLEQAIFHCEQALTVYTQEAFPQDWAMTQNNLANIYADRIRGERAENIEQVIFHIEQALEFYTRETFPKNWAWKQNILAGAYLERIREDRANNLEQAISYYQQALEVFTREAFPEEWAWTQARLADAYRHRIWGERAENIEQAISHCKQALTVYTQNAFPQDWAETQNNLALAYWDRMQGERAGNLELAISSFQQALAVHTHEAFPQDWAMTQNNLATAYRDRIRGERAENLELALSHNQQALEVFTREAFPKEWASTQHGLATAYSQRILGERAENLEQAISAFQQVLEVFTRETFPDRWASTQNNLAFAYIARIRGERAENLEQAISALQQVLEVRTREAFPQEWAETQINLAGTYGKRIRGDRAENIEQAISYCQQALEVFTREAFPDRWAMVQTNLANAYSARSKGDEAEDLEQAIFHFKQVLQVHTREAFPQQWASTQLNLAIAYSVRIRGERSENLEQAISYCQQALEVFTREAFPQQWAMVQHHLMYVFSVRIRGERSENLEQAISHGRQALEVRTPTAFPQGCRDTTYRLGSLLYDAKRYSEAHTALETTHQAVEALRGEVQRDLAKRTLAAENADLYARLVSCCLQEGDEVAAFRYAVAGKGRAFVDQLASIRLDPSTLEATDPALAEALRTDRDLHQQIDALRNTLLDREGDSPIADSSISLDPDVLNAQLAALQQQAASHWEELVYNHPALTATQQAPTLSAEQACALANELGATLVEYYRHAQGWGAFVVTAQGVHFISLPLMDDDLLARMVSWVQQVESPSGTGRNPLSYRRLSEWYEAIFFPLRTSLSLDRQIILAPFGQLHLLPLAAARHPQTGRFVAEDYLLAFAPSLAALYTVREQSRRTSDGRATTLRRLLNVAYPGSPGSAHHLPNVLPEAQAIAASFAQVTPLYQEAATPDAVVAYSREQDAMHFGCHGWFDVEQPEESGLLLAGGILTVQRIINELRLGQACLATLGSCESGRAALQSGDEYTGLMQAMLTTGVQAVVSSLWKVDDTATHALFTAFYARLVAGHSPAQSLQEAARLVREHPEHPNWAHPYFWAAFQVSGLALDLQQPT